MHRQEEGEVLSKPCFVLKKLIPTLTLEVNKIEVMLKVMFEYSDAI